jgi:tetratricopeptide (TPR) repeat protein
MLLLLPTLLVAGPSEDFQEGVRLYDQGDFAASAEKFQSVADQGYSSAALCYNAGCAYYKAGRLGMAVANFRRAERLAPDDGDVRANLAFVKQFGVDKLETAPEESFSSKSEGYLAMLHPNQYFLISFIAFTLIFVFLGLKRIGLLGRIGNSPVVILALVTVVCVVAMTIVLRANYLIDEGVIVVEQTEIVSGPGSDFELQFEGHEGLMFKILDQKEGYYLGLFANKLKGWIKESAVERI